MDISGCSYFVWCLLMVASWCASSDGYKTRGLQNYLCADKLLITIQKTFRGDPTLTLSDDKDSAAIISQVWNTTLPGYYKSNKLDYDCHFRVETDEKHPRGIYIIISHLKFRRNMAGGCTDYIQFSGGNKSPSERICRDISNEGPSDRLMFEDRDREVKVHIHIDKRYMIQEPLELRMVLTAHSECKYTGDFLCNPKDQYSCISKHFVRDNITNCLYPCRDEMSCAHDTTTVQEIDTTSVAISAITTFLFTLFGVGFCIWMCWKYWYCFSNPNGVGTQGGFPRSGSSSPASAPPFDDIITSNIDAQQENEQQPPTPKDLPPSYESLFPDR